MFYDEQSVIDDDDWRKLGDYLHRKMTTERRDERGLLMADRRYKGKTEWTGEDRRVQNLRDQTDN